jgi:hypothetical protein
VNVLNPHPVSAQSTESARVTAARGPQNQRTPLRRARAGTTGPRRSHRPIVLGAIHALLVHAPIFRFALGFARYAGGAARGRLSTFTTVISDTTPARPPVGDGHQQGHSADALGRAYAALHVWTDAPKARSKFPPQ